MGVSLFFKMGEMLERFWLESFLDTIFFDLSFFELTVLMETCDLAFLDLVLILDLDFNELMEALFIF